MNKLIIPIIIAILFCGIVNPLFAQSLLRFFEEETFTERGEAVNQSTGEIIQREFFQKIDHLEFSPDGSMLLLISGEIARIRDTESGALITEFIEHGEDELDDNQVFFQGDILDGAFSEDGSRVITGGFRNTAFIWDVITGQVLQKLELPLDLARSPSEQTIDAIELYEDNAITTALGFENGGIWDLNSLQLTKLSTTASDIVFFPDKSKIIIDQGSESQIYTFPEGEWLYQIEGGDPVFLSEMNVMRFFRGVSRSADEPALQIKDFNLENGELIKAYEPINTGGAFIDFSPNGKFLTIVPKLGSLNRVEFWKSETRSLSNTLTSTHLNKIDQFAFSPDGMKLAAVDGNKVSIYDVSQLTSSIPDAVNLDE